MVLGERRARRDCYHRHQNEGYQENRKNALHSLSPPLLFSRSEQFHLALKTGITTTPLASGLLRLVEYLDAGAGLLAQLLSKTSVQPFLLERCS